MKKELFFVIVFFFISINSFTQDNYIDLKLPSGTLWATSNLGASKPEECGNYFAWAEVTPHLDTVYTWKTYKYLKKIRNGRPKVKKYCTQKDLGKKDELTILQMQDDAATYNLGTEWKIPNKDNIKELLDGCNWEWIPNYCDSNVSGCLGTSKYNGEKIFFPAAGYYSDGAGSYSEKDLNNKNVTGMYWTSNLYTGISEGAVCFVFDKTNNLIAGNYRYQGLSIRPIKSK